MVDKLLREPKERLLVPLVRPFPMLDPVVVTLLAFAAGLLAAAACALRWYGAAVALWALNRLLDGLDGTLARCHGKQTDLGGYLDMLADVVVYAVVPLGLTVGVGTPVAYGVAAILLAAFYINLGSWMYLSALLEKRNSGARANGELTTITMPGGLIEGTETVVFYLLFVLFPQALVPLFGLMAALVLVTVGQRIVWAARVLKVSR